MKFFLFALFLTPISYGAEYISHAGGEYNGLHYTNSAEAIANTYTKGLRYLEIDLNVTSDGFVVLIHDWENTWQNLYQGEKGQVPTLAEFENAQTEFTQLDFERFLVELKKYPDLKVILDIKTDVEFTLMTLMFYDIDFKHMIPQIFTEEQFELAESLGFENILLALYREEAIDVQKWESFANNNRLLGFTVSKERVFSENYKTLLEKFNTFVFTVNDESLKSQLQTIRNIKGIFTDKF